jgi:hypothetical protein
MWVINHLREPKFRKTGGREGVAPPGKMADLYHYFKSPIGIIYLLSFNFLILSSGKN